MSEFSNFGYKNSLVSVFWCFFGTCLFLLQGSDVHLYQLATLTRPVQLVRSYSNSHVLCFLFVHNNSVLAVYLVPLLLAALTGNSYDPLHLFYTIFQDFLQPLTKACGDA